MNFYTGPHWSSIVSQSSVPLLLHLLLNCYFKCQMSCFLYWKSNDHCLMQVQRRQSAIISYKSTWHKTTSSETASHSGAKLGFTIFTGPIHLFHSKLSFGDDRNMTPLVIISFILVWMMLQWQGNEDLVIISWSGHGRLMITCVFVISTNHCLSTMTIEYEHGCWCRTAWH